MTPELPDRHAYDPGAFPADLAFAEESSLVVLLATPESDEDGWALRAAVSLARDWAAGGERVFLGDLALARPRLHETLDEANGEGMTDAFLYGASLRRVAHPVRGGFFFAPAGTPVADARAVLASDRWDVIVHGFARAGAHLVVYVTSDTPGVDGLLERADQVVLLAPSGEAEALADVPGVDRADAVLFPAGGWEEAVAAAGETPATELEAWPVEPAMEQGTGPGTSIDVEPVSAGVPAGGEAPEGGGGGVAAPASAPARGTAAAAPDGGRGGGGSRVRTLLLLLLLVAVAAVALWSLGIVEIPGFAMDTAPGPAPAGRTTAPAPDGVYSLTLGSFQDGALAGIQAESLTAQRSDLLFVVAPVELDGEVFHRLLVGMAPDSAAAALRADLARTLSRENPSGWVSRPTPFAFHLGRFDSLEVARSRAEELRAVRIPAYVLRSPSATEPGFDIWAGAYADAAEAAYLQRVLQVDEIPATLTRRRGELPE